MKEVTFIQSYSGTAVDFMDPQENQIDIDDIAHALSLLCRFGGHCSKFYSVAEHSVRATRAVADEFKREALLHDATEAYLIDMPRPIKQVLSGYRKIEAGLDKVIRAKFGLPSEMSPEIKLIDNVMLATEKRDLMKVSERPWSELPDPLPGKITPWSPGKAYDEFMAEYERVSF